MRVSRHQNDNKSNYQYSLKHIAEHKILCSWISSFIPLLFSSFFCPCLSCLLPELLISPYSYFFLISFLVFYRLTSFFSATLAVPFSLRDFRVPSFYSLSHNYSVHLCHRILSPSLSTPPVYNMIFSRNS